MINICGSTVPPWGQRKCWRRIPLSEMSVSCLSFCWQVPPLQGKLQYMRVLNDLPPFGGILFHTVGLVIHFSVFGCRNKCAIAPFPWCVFIVHVVAQLACFFNALMQHFKEIVQAVGLERYDVAFQYHKQKLKPPVFFYRMRNNQLQHYWWVLDMALVM